VLNKILVVCVLAISSYSFAQEPGYVPPTVTAPYVPPAQAYVPPTVTAPYVPPAQAYVPPTVTAPYVPPAQGYVPPAVTAPYVPVIAPVPDPIGAGMVVPKLTKDQCDGLRAGMSWTSEAMKTCEENKLAISEDIIANNVKIFDAIKAYRDAAQNGASFMVLMDLMAKVTALQATGAMLDMEKVMNAMNATFLQTQYDSLFQKFLAGGCLK
jgi:hypothetical protein